MNRTSTVAALVVAATCTAAWADSPRLNGAYSFTGAGTCLWAPGSAQSAPPPTNTAPLPNAGFCDGPGSPLPSCTAQGHPVDGKVFSSSFSVEGIRTFNDDGTGTVSGSEVNLTVPPTPQAPGYPAFPPGASTDTFTYKFQYTLDGEGGWTAHVIPGTFTVNHVLGGRAGQTSSVANFPDMVGTIGEDGKTLTIATADPNSLTQEIVSFSNGDVWPRICQRSRVLLKLQHSGDDNGDGHDH
jgi:hypothetical protein